MYFQFCVFTDLSARERPNAVLYADEEDVKRFEDLVKLFEEEGGKVDRSKFKWTVREDLYLATMVGLLLLSPIPGLLFLVGQVLGGEITS